MSVPRCKKGSRRCPVTKKCVPKKSNKTARCKKGSRKCSDSKCYRKNKSSKSRRNHKKKYKL